LDDYREMWAGPGLDLDAHDALLGVPGNACDEVLSRGWTVPRG
jgi:hypothetical protein